MASRPQNSGTSPGGKGIQVFAIVISIIAIMAVAVFSAAMYVRNRRRKQKAVNNALRWGSSYRDEPDDSVNLAPRRQSSYLDPYPVNNHSSSTDPMASHLAPKSPAASNEMDSIIRAAIEEDDSEDFEDAPQVYIGPPRDEDGHELHNVEII